MHRRLAQRLEQVAPRLGGDGAKGQRRIGRAEGRGARRRDRLVQRADRTARPLILLTLP